MTEKNIMAYTRRKALFSATLAAAMMPLMAGAQTSKESDDRATRYVLGIDGMACPFCAFGVEKKLNALDGVSKLDTNILAGTVFVTMEPGKTLSEKDARLAVEEAGFDLRDFKEDSGAS